MKIGNIYTTSDVNVPDDFNIVSSKDEIIENIPTLIIGWDYVKKEYPTHNILKRTLSENLYWTFKKNEKRELHDEDIYKFVQSAYKKIIQDTTYIFIDPILFSKKKIKKVINKINSSNNIIAYQHDSMIYMYVDKIIFGIDLELIEFVGINVERLIERINKKAITFLFKSDIFIEYKKRIEFIDNQVKYIPLLYSIKYG